MKLLRLPVTRLLVMTLFAATLLLPMTVDAQQPTMTTSNCAWMYGMDDLNRIVEYNPEQKVVRGVFDTKWNGTRCCNSFAFDISMSNMYFIHQGGQGCNSTLDGLYRWNQGGSSVNRIASLTVIKLSGTGNEFQNPENAAFANNTYYFIKNKTKKIVSCSVGSVPFSCQEKSITDSWFDFLNGGVIPPADLAFGDMTINQAGSTMYGATENGYFFNITGVTTNSPVLRIIKRNTATPKNPSIQLAFGGLYNVLYATDYQNGTWYTVNTNTGALTIINDYTTSSSSGFGARDLGGSACRPASTGGSASGDPHLVGANGAEYFFVGEPGGNYSLFSSPWYQVTMQLSTRIHHNQRWMTAAGVLFRNESFLFSNETFIYDTSAGAAPAPSFQDDVTARLNRVGGKVLAWSSEWAELELCPGHVVTLHNSNDYLDVDISVPSCQDSYGGALGQTFQCHGLLEDETFVWSSAQEESFQIPTLFTPTGAFQMNSTCAEPLSNGRKRKTKTKVEKEPRLFSRLSGKIRVGDNPRLL
jgi:hypothetical protein